MLGHRSTVLFIALRYILGKSVDNFSRCIYWITSFAIMLGIMAIIIVMSVMNGFERELQQNLLNFIPHALLTTSQGYVHVKCKPTQLVLNTLHDIVRMQPLVISDVILQSIDQASCGVMLGIDINNFEPVSAYLFNRNINQLVAGKYYIIIGSELAQKLKVQINDQIRLIIPSVMQITPVSYIPSQRLFTVLDIYRTTSEVDAYQVLIHQVDASALMHYPLQCVTGWRLWLHDPLLITSYDNKLPLPEDWIWKDWREYKGSLFQAIKIEKNIMFLLLSLIVIAAGFNIIAFLALLILEKQVEIAVLQTYGVTRKQIMFIFIIQGMSNGIFGILFGTGLGVFLSSKLNYVLLFLKIFPDTFQFPVEIRYFQILGIVLMAFFVVVLATLYPSWRATSLHPAKILNHG